MKIQTQTKMMLLAIIAVLHGAVIKSQEGPDMTRSCNSSGLDGGGLSCSCSACDSLCKLQMSEERTQAQMEQCRACQKSCTATVDNATYCSASFGSASITCPNATYCSASFGSASITCPNATSCNAGYDNASVTCPNATSCNAGYGSSKACCPKAIGSNCNVGYGGSCACPA